MIWSKKVLNSKDQQDLFYAKIQDYISQGVVREVCSFDRFTVLSLGERILTVCPYEMIEGKPYGIYLNDAGLLKLVEDPERIDETVRRLLKGISEGKYKNRFFDFSASEVEYWKNSWIPENANESIPAGLEEQIVNSGEKQKKRG